MSLRLTLSQFRCWVDEIEVEFNLGNLILLKGTTGSGKTTILNSIVWCLYGTLRLVAPNGNDKAKTSVRLEIPKGDKNIIIIRSRNPSRLIIEIQEDDNICEEYEDKPAQAFIEENFGTYEMWLTSCYIQQGMRNNFLSMSNKEKMELLNSIAFSACDPAVEISKIQTRIDECTTETNEQKILLEDKIK